MVGGHCNNNPFKRDVPFLGLIRVKYFNTLKQHIAYLVAQLALNNVIHNIKLDIST